MTAAGNEATLRPAPPRTGRKLSTPGVVQIEKMALLLEGGSLHPVVTAYWVLQRRREQAAGMGADGDVSRADKSERVGKK